MRIDITALKPEDRRLFASLLVEAGYRVHRGARKVPVGKSSKTLYHVDYDKPKEEEAP